MITENLSTLKIHKLTQAQYNRELEAGNIDENALYLTPDTSPDWNVNDETNPAYIKNRPFYSDIEDMVMIDATNLTLNAYTYNGQGGLYNTSFDHYNLPNAGEVAHVIFNGTTYDFVLEESDSSFNDFEPFGDTLDELQAGTGTYGFQLTWQVWGSHYSYLYTTTETVNEFKVVVDSFTYKQLDEKYIAYKPGKIVTGETFTVDGVDTVANNGAETFNNYANNIATGMCSHAEGYETIASGNGSHAEGQTTKAAGVHSHAEGLDTTASGNQSHAEGSGTKASGWTSHAEGYFTIASGDYSHVQGTFNIEDTANKYAHIVGNGTEEKSRSNAHTLDWSGNAWYQGDVYVGGTSQDDGKKLATEEYVDTSVANLVDSAPEDLNTLNELATAMKENSDVVEVLNNAITNKADKPTANDALALLMEVGMIDPIVDTDESIYIEDENMIYTF